MTHAERLRELAASVDDDEMNLYPVEREAMRAGADALDRLAQTCGNCRHASDEYAVEDWTCCSGPRGAIDGWVPKSARCDRWTNREDA